MTNIHVIVARPIEEEDKRKVESFLTAKYGDHSAVYHVDDSLLGGIVIFDGEKVYDGSLKNKLRSLKNG